MSHSRFSVDLQASPLMPVAAIVAVAQQELQDLLLRVEMQGGLSQDHYIRYLSFQYHLTRDVQRAFLAVASSAALSDRRPLREFLFTFALEEEPHYSIAAKDLADLGATPLDCPLDVKLWWAYFDATIPVAPFVRLGATCVLENLGAGGADVARRLLSAAPFITASNSRFIQIHFHEALPHGDQIYQALSSVPLSAAEIADLVRGAKEGGLMYLRMAAWALHADPIARALCGAEAPVVRQ